jgi:eukaryotic-like serine/threonine-protein kinase
MVTDRDVVLSEPSQPQPTGHAERQNRTLHIRTFAESARNDRMGNTAPSTAVDPLFLSLQEALAGHYALERELGRGGMAVVYLARDVRLDRPVAIKLLPPDLAAHDKLRDRFMREARTAARLSHPHIVPIHSVDEVRGYVFYVMSYVEGETLAERVAKRGPLPPREASRLLQEVAGALAAAHAQGIVHRDVKPGNILLEHATNRAMVTDFGIARVADAGETPVGELLGTPEYMSPEQAAGDAVDARSDVYSLGVVAYYMVSGQLPFTAPTIQAVLAKQLTQPPPPVASVAPGIPRSLANAIETSLIKDPSRRFQSAEAFSDALAPTLVRQREVPVPIRAFLDPRKMWALAVSPAMMITGGFVVLTTGLPHLFTTLGYVGLIRAVGAGNVLLGALMPLILTMRWLRPLLRGGYTVSDIAGALRASFDARREELLFEFGTKPTAREKRLHEITVGGAILNVGAWTALALGATAYWLLPFAFVSGIWPIAGVLSATTSRARSNKGSWWAKRWEGMMGRWLTKIASIKLGARSAGADRPTEMAIAFSAQALYDELPKPLRQSLGNVPALVDQLERQARAMREQIVALDERIASAKSASGSVQVGELQESVVADLTRARIRASERLADLLAALEATRLDLLRLRAGQATADQITNTMIAARELGDDVDRLLSARAEIDAALRPSPPPMGAEPTPA